mgnify:CR=1 FL=1
MLAFSSPASPSPYAHGSLHRLVGRVLHGTGCREGAEGQESWEGSKGQWAVFGGPGAMPATFHRALLSCVDLIVSGRVLIEMATPVTPVTPSAALVLFPTDSDDLERGNDSGTPLPTSDNGDNSLGYTGRVHLSKILLTASL